MESFIKILQCSSKKELEKICKSHEVNSDDFVNFILFCATEHCHLDHALFYHDYVPEHLEATDRDFEILNQPIEAQTTIKSKKSLKRVFKSHCQRKYKVGHLFYEKPRGQIGKEWHFIFFEINEIKNHNNHWVAGSHFHIVNYHWPNLNIHQVWDDFVSNKRFPNAKLHVRYRK